MTRLEEFPGYLITEEGNVFSERQGILKQMAGNTFRAPGREDGTYYKRVTLRKDGVTTMRFIHRLVLETFVPNPENKPQVNHIDGNGLNNHISNLEWVTNGENVKHSYDVLGRTAAWEGIKGKDNPSSKPILQLSKDMKIVREFESARHASDETGFGYKPISAAVTGEVKTYKGFHWRFKYPETEWKYKRDWKQYNKDIHETH